MQKENSTVANVLFALSGISVMGAAVNYHFGFNGDFYFEQGLRRAAHMMLGHSCLAGSILLVFMGTLLNYVKRIAEATELSIPKSKIEKVDNLIFKKNEPSQFEKMLVTED